MLYCVNATPYYVPIFFVVPLFDDVLFLCCTVQQCCTTLMFQHAILHYFDIELFDVALLNVEGSTVSLSTYWASNTLKP